MNSSSGKSAAVSSSAAAGKNEVITIDLCLSDTDDEHEPAFKSSSSTAAAATAASLKRTSNPGKPKGKSKRPKPDPAAFANDNDSGVEIIEISDDEDEDDGKQSAASSAYASSTSATSTTSASKSAARGMQVRSVTLSVEGAAMLMASRTMAKEEPTADIRKKVNGDDEVELVEAPSNSGWRQVSATAAASAGAENTGTGNAASASTSGRTGQPKDDRTYETNAESKVDDDDEEEFELVATKGTNALIDFPHSRENCVQFSFANGDMKAHCDNCYCYVCDIPAKDCKKWNEHCQACHGERRWREERERFKRLGIEAASASAQPAAAAAASTVSTVSTAPRMAVSVARPSNMWGIIDASTYANRPDLPQYSITALLQKLTSVHPVEVAPPTNSGFVTNLRHYQKQSLAFMLDIERSTGPSPLKKELDGVPHRGGFLCDEVGMGKSAVVLALVASNPLPSNEVPTREQMKEQIKLARKRAWEQERINSMGQWKAKQRGLQLSPIKRMKIKASVILTSASLLGQWEDECRKHCPGLVVRIAHSSRSKKDPSTFHYLYSTDIEKIDIIISTSTFDWEGRRGDKFPHFFSAFEFRRVVVDESHLFGKGNSANCCNACKFLSTRRWCVTATPCTGSIEELFQQLMFLGQLSDGISYLMHSKPYFYRFLDALKPIFIRHTKSQRINGSAALALPASSSTTTLVTMSASERRKMSENLMPHLISKYRRSGRGEKAFTITKALGLSAGYGCKSKLSLLINDLQALRLKEPNLRAVVFTQSRDTHSEIINAFKYSSFEVLQFSGSTSAKNRDQSIRSFQSSSPRPAVFVITMRAGNVGITLTAASRVYLMEPCLDPAVEVQAAGRIHRLGQTKPVHVIRYAFKNSPEQNITQLHQKVVAGRVSITDGHVPPRAIKILSAGI